MSEYIDVTTQAYKMRGFYGYRRYSIIDEQGADNCFCGGNMDSDEYTEDASNESHKGNRWYLCGEGCR